MYFTVYLLIGAFAGLLAGMLGIGGGIIVVPALSAVFAHYALVPDDYVMHMAIGTSMAAIIITLLSSLRAQMQRKAVRWDMVRQILPGLLLGVVLGAAVTRHLPSAYLRIFFSVFLLSIAWRIFKDNHKTHDDFTAPLPSVRVIKVSSLIIGMLCSMLGAAGGTMLIPFLLRCRVGMREATGTSVACGVCVGILATISFMMMGRADMVVISGNTGFIYWPAWLGIVISSAIFAPLGTAIAYKLPTSVLKRVLAVFLVLVAIDMVLPGK